MLFKICEQLMVGVRPKTTCIVRHDIRLSGNVILGRHVTVLSLTMQRVEAEQVGPGRCGCGRPLVGPGQGGPVVRGHPHGLLGNVVGVDQDVLVCHQRRQFEVRN